MKDKIKTMTDAAVKQIKACMSGAEVNEHRVRLLGKSGEFTALLRGLKDLPADERAAAGQLLNNERKKLEDLLDAKEAAFKKSELAARLKNEYIDISLDTRVRRGSLHPLTLVTNEIVEIFIGMGFSVYDGREVETDYYNFEALNLPADHPARMMQDTFYITDKTLLRTQTSTTQVRVMEQTKPPIKMINPGRVYRADEIDATHSPMFHQIEGLVVDKNITMCDLKGTLEAFAKRFFNENTKTRLRPSFFPFTEPSVEVDATCAQCGGGGCRVCKGTGWLEILGAGVVNRKVLANCGIDPDVYSGFAFGIGVDRTAAIKYAVTDLRVMFENDIRFLRQFK
ncbi:MAG: phenylalanine--tRNA ligase subunit alpha [Firmicutes bacterium]|nr:phenylalanine--tRNA ligase subunit alpha [Bacillota bacterium]